MLLPYSYVKKHKELMKKLELIKKFVQPQQKQVRKYQSGHFDDTTKFIFRKSI